MSTIELSINCCLCDKVHSTNIYLPHGWEYHTSGIDSETNGFCPDHATVAAFTDSQCPGCVGGWGDCPMWRAFAYSEQRDIGPGDFKAIEAGICPRRVNGTMSISRAGIADVDLSERAPAESGQAFAEAIRDYCARYPTKKAAA